MNTEDLKMIGLSAGGDVKRGETLSNTQSHFFLEREEGKAEGVGDRES